MGIPYAKKYTVTLSGTTLKEVHCESCHAEYVYQIKRTAGGTGTSLLFLDNQGARERADQDAKNNLRAILEREIDVVPCPICGWYQATMVLKVQRGHGVFMRDLGIVLLVIASAAFYFSFLEGAPGNRALPWWHTTSAMVAAACAGIGAGLVIIKVILSRRYDPNSADRDTRIALGKARAITKEQLGQLLRERAKGAGRAPTSSSPTETRAAAVGPAVWEADDSR
jgi:hypothetical protein